MKTSFKIKLAMFYAKNRKWLVPVLVVVAAVAGYLAYQRWA